MNRKRNDIIGGSGVGDGYFTFATLKEKNNHRNLLSMAL